MKMAGIFQFWRCMCWLFAWRQTWASAMSVREGTYLPARESDRGKNLKNIKAFSTRVQDIRRQGGNVEFIFGFSTGHVGTTTLSSKKAYRDEDLAKKQIHFVFERGGVPPSTCGRSSWDLKKEIVHVEFYYGPELLRSVANPKVNNTIVDLSHANICFYRGLVNVLHSHQIAFRFIRIRRDRYETTLSMSIQDNSRVDFFRRDYYRYHPFENVPLVHLKIPGGNATWSSFSMTQKLLWVIDETQARWESLVARHPDLPRAEIMWSKENDNIKDGVRVVGDALGVRPKPVTPTTKVHAGDKQGSDKLRAAVVAQDMIYRKKMGFNSTEPELEHFETPQRKEAIRRVKYLFLVNNRTNTNHGNTSSANANSTMIDTFAGAHMKSLLAHTPHFEAKTSAELDGAIVDA